MTQNKLSMVVWEKRVENEDKDKFFKNKPLHGSMMALYYELRNMLIINHIYPYIPQSKKLESQSIKFLCKCDKKFF